MSEVMTYSDTMDYLRVPAAIGIGAVWANAERVRGAVHGVCRWRPRVHVRGGRAGGVASRHCLDAFRLHETRRPKAPQAVHPAPATAIQRNNQNAQSFTLLRSLCAHRPITLLIPTPPHRNAQRKHFRSRSQARHSRLRGRRLRGHR